MLHNDFMIILYHSQSEPPTEVHFSCRFHNNGSCKFLVEIPTAGPSADTLKLTALPSRFATRLKLME